MNYIITGGHTGIGLELTKRLLKERHKIGLIVRSEKRKNDALNQFNNNDSLDVFVGDLSKRDQIEDVANQIKNSWEKVDGLFNNAGLLLDKLYVSDYGNEMQLEVNGISPYLLTKALKSLLDKAEKPFIVNTATEGLHKKKSINIPEFKKPKKFRKIIGSYLDSKLIMILLMNHLDKKWENVRFVSVNPGSTKTTMTSGKGMPSLLKPIANLFFQKPEKAAKNIYDAAFDSKYKGSGIYVLGGKVQPMKFEITNDEINQLLN